MAGKTPTELNDLIAGLRTELEVLAGEVRGLRADFDRNDLNQLRERLVKLEAVLQAVNVPALLLQLGVLQEQIAELRKWREEADRRRWQVLMLFAGSLLTLLVQVALLAVKK
ncbi:MAG: hypothetical protein C0501_12770 [Isosphaera sp.]|nr:hypothetical protein [Isosphaera sp.]